MTTRAVRRREAAVEANARFMPNGGQAQKDRRLFQALYSAIGEYDLALQVCDKIILWPGPKPDAHYLRRWATEIQMNEATADPALEKVMAGAFERYKSNRHWEFIEGQIRAANRIAAEVEETGSTKSAAAVSYLGANANYGMDKGSHAPQTPKTQQLNIGNVRIVTNRSTPQLKPSDVKKAKRLAAPMLAGEFRTIDKEVV